MCETAEVMVSQMETLLYRLSIAASVPWKHTVPDRRRILQLRHKTAVSNVAAQEDGIGLHCVIIPKRLSKEHIAVPMLVVRGKEVNV